MTKRQRIPEVHFFEFRVASWLNSVTRLTSDLATRALYFDALVVCYKDGWLPADPVEMAALCRCSSEEVTLLWPRISRHFYKDKHDPKKLRNHFADSFRRDYFSYIRKQRERGRTGGSTMVLRKSNTYDNLGSAGLSTGQATAKPPLKPIETAAAAAAAKETDTKRQETAAAAAQTDGQQQQSIHDLWPETAAAIVKFFPATDDHVISAVVNRSLDAYREHRATGNGLRDSDLAEAVRRSHRDNQRSAALFERTVPQCIRTWCGRKS